MQPQAEGSTTSALTEVLVELSDGDKEDLEAISKIYNQFWMECQGYYIFEMDEKRELSIDQLDIVPIDWTICAYEERGMEKMQNYFLNMPDQTARQTLCIMPQCDRKPTSWDEVKEGRFWIINGQHSVVASQSIQTMDISEAVKTSFRKWSCFIVYSKSKEKLRKISAYYNCVNHFSVFKPSWSMNILSARFIWTELGSPLPSKSVTAVGRAVRANIRDKENDRKYKVIPILSFRSTQAEGEK